MKPLISIRRDVGDVIKGNTSPQPKPGACIAASVCQSGEIDLRRRSDRTPNRAPMLTTPMIIKKEVGGSGMGGVSSATVNSIQRMLVSRYV